MFKFTKEQNGVDEDGEQLYKYVMNIDFNFDLDKFLFFGVIFLGVGLGVFHYLNQ